jgi:glycine oxidase
MRNVVRSSDVVVIGAGIVGCAIAAELAVRGRAVTVLDARAPGAGATQASGGMLAPYSEAAEHGTLLQLATRSLGLFDRFVTDLQARTGIDVGYQRTGTLHVARTDAALASLDALARELASIDVSAERLSAAEARAREPNLAADVGGALLIPTQGLLSASQTTRALLQDAQGHGAVVLSSRRAQSIRLEAEGLEVETESERLRARSVVLAAGAWSGQVRLDGIEDSVPVKPIRGQLLHLGWQGAPVQRVTWDERCYTIPWADGTLLVGATVEDAGFEERTTVAGVRDLLEAACDLLPHAWTAHVLSARVGLRPASPDGLPIIGWSDVLPGLMYATAHYRNGVLLTPLTAQLVADAIVERRLDPALELTRPGRFGRL